MAGKKNERMCEMSQPVYKVWLAKTTEAWYALSPEEQNKLMEMPKGLDSLILLPED